MEGTYFPWYTLTTAAAFAFGVWVLSAAALRLIRVRVFLLGASGAVFGWIGASAAFFL